MATHGERPRLRSQLWFDNPDNPGMTAVYLERYLNYGLTREGLTSAKPMIGIAQTGSDLSPCNRHHLELAKRVREGVRDAGGLAFEFPMHPIQETGRRPTAALDRNLAYLGLVEVLYGYPLDGVVLTTGCDKTTPAAIMAAATVNIPAIVLSGGPMLNGWWKGERAGSGTVVWWARQEHAAGRMDYEEFLELVSSSAPSIGHCNTMGTASTMNALAEALGLSLPGCAAIPAPYREREQIAYDTGRRAVEIVRENLKPSDILTHAAFENAIVVCSAIGGSTNAPIHLNAIARHVGVPLAIEDWERIGPAAISARNIAATSVISEDFRQRYLLNPQDPNAFEGRAVVFDGPEDYHQRIDDPSLQIDEHTILFIRGVGPIGYPGSAEVVNMQPPAALIKQGVTSSPSILNASPAAAAGGGLALLETGDRVRIDLNKGAANILISDAELAQRRAALEKRGGYRCPPSQTPWQEIQRGMVDQLADGMVLKPAVKYRRVAQLSIPRDNH